ncbi:hypothetical protein ACFLS9_07105 [Bacteroidota bacterium]
MKTKVNEDGSIEKSITVVSRDSITNIDELDIPIDESWEIETEKDSSTSNYILTATKKFDSVSDLLDNFYANPNGIIIEVNLAKKGRWFYTYYEYEEIFEKINPFNALKVEDYLTEDEMEQLTSHEISESLSEKLGKYILDSAFEEFFLGIKKIVAGNDLDTLILEKNKSELKNCLEEEEIECINLKIESFYNSDNINNVNDQVTDLYSKLEKKVDVLIPEGSNFKHYIDMPGLIISTNAESIEGSVAGWTFNSENFTYIDYKMKVESRVTNIWMMILTGAIVLILLALLLVPRFRKKIKH